MAAGSLKFGTSGLRGLATDLQGQGARRYTRAFLDHLAGRGGLASGRVMLGQDLRASSAGIAQDCAVAIAAAGLVPVDCGAHPTPALALHAMASGCAGIMVTGSHIPGDRNGLKFYGLGGEITRDDEAGILAALRDDAVGDVDIVVMDEAASARERYFSRFRDVLPPDALTGLRLGVFEHSSVARDVLTQVLRHFGAEIISLGRTDAFVAVDTEALGDAVFAPLAGWRAQYGLDGIVSADGDGDRPLLMDGRGRFVRGDVLGLLTAQYLGADSVVTPVTSNSAIERTGLFGEVIRTRVGSPYVIAAMERAAGSVVGFEANGGTLVGAGISGLAPLPTRDAVLPILCALGLAVEQGVTLVELVDRLPLQHAMADRLQDVPSERSAAFLARLGSDEDYVQRLFAPHAVASVSDVDGKQFWLTSGDMVHFRASGNAPELRCYVEGRTAEVAQSLLDWGMQMAAREVGRS